MIAHEPDLVINIDPLTNKDSLCSEWRSLEVRAEPSFFLTWHWIGPWIETIEQPLWVLRARLDNEVVGLVLLTLKLNRRHGFLMVSTLYINQTGDEAKDVVTIEFNDILVDNRHEEFVWKACVNFLMNTQHVSDRRIDAIAWRGASETVQKRLSGLGVRWRYLAEAPSAAIDLAAVRRKGVSFLDTLSANTRQQIRRSMKLYRERGPLRLEIASTVDQALAFFREAGAFHQTRWQSRGKPGAFAYPFYVAFHDVVIRQGLPKGVIELVCVRAGNEPIGFLYNFLYNGRVSYYFSGFRYGIDNRLKPGLVTHTLCIEHHLRGNMQTYDFMAGDNRYKRNLGSSGPRIVALAIEHPRLLLRAETMLRQIKNLLIRK